MTFGEMHAYTIMLKEVLDSSQIVKDARLAALMSYLEMAYDIPALRNESFEEQNPFVMQLYRTAAEERALC